MTIQVRNKIHKANRRARLRGGRLLPQEGCFRWFGLCILAVAKGVLGYCLERSRVCLVRGLGFHKYLHVRAPSRSRLAQNYRAAWDMLTEAVSCRKPSLILKPRCSLSLSNPQTAITQSSTSGLGMRKVPIDHMFTLKPKPETIRSSYVT